MINQSFIESFLPNPKIPKVAEVGQRALSNSYKGEKIETVKIRFIESSQPNTRIK
jgi:hypothetical protein